MTDTVTKTKPKAKKAKALVPQKYENREAWLKAAYDVLSNDFAAQFAAEEQFDGKPFEVQIATGWPRQDRNGKVIGQCWASKSGKGVRNIFISPLLADPIDVLSTLLHEMIHAHDDCNNKHKGAFVRVAKAVGFVGKPTSTPPGDELKDYLKTLSGQLGYYPHTAMNPSRDKVQTTRMLKVACPDCGCIVRMTQKWVDTSGIPTCGCGTKMEEG